MTGQNISHAVMAQRHEAKDSLDDFPTPPWATRALLEHVINGKDLNLQSCWEPACGEGHMAKVLEGRKVVMVEMPAELVARADAAAGRELRRVAVLVHEARALQAALSCADSASVTSMLISLQFCRPCRAVLMPYT